MRTYADGALVVKTMATPEHLAAKFASWGQPLDKASWAPVKGNALSSARMLLEQSMRSFYIARDHLGGIAAPFVILDGRYCLMEGSYNVIEQNGERATVPFFQTVTLVQQRVQTFEEVVPGLVSAGREEDVFAVFTKYVEVVRGMWRRGVFFEVMNFHNDYGIDEQGNVLLIDLGELTTDEAKAKKYIEKRKMFEEYAFRWLTQVSPRTADHYRHIADERLTVDSLKGFWKTEAPVIVSGLIT